MTTEPGAASTEQRAATKRRAISTQRIQASIRAGQACGLTATGITHHADGSTSISFAQAIPQKATPRGWNTDEKSSWRV